MFVVSKKNLNSALDYSRRSSLDSFNNVRPMRTSALVKASVYVYVVVMAALFVNQTWLSVDKYLQKEIVEDVSMTRNTTAVMPPLTFCALPGFKKALDAQDLQLFSSYCPNRTDIVECINEMRFDVNELVISTFRYPGTDPPRPISKADWHPSSFNLAMGSCFTHQKLDPEPYSQSWGDILVFNLTNEYLVNGWSFFVFFHSSGDFIPSIGMASEFMGQQYVGWNPEPATVKHMTVGVTHRHVLNSEKRPCKEEANYSVVKCMEDFSTAEAGCKSPWDQFHVDKSTRLCESPSDFERLFSVHLEIMNLGAIQFEQRAGCLPPCSFTELEFASRTYKNPHITDIFGGEGVGAIALSLRSTNQRISREAWLYQLHNLVGEIGGCLGMFLGVSLVSLYQMGLGAVENAVKYVQRK